MLFALSPTELVTNRNNILSSDGSLSFIHSQLENEQKRQKVLNIVQIVKRVVNCHEKKFTAWKIVVCCIVESVQQ